MASQPEFQRPPIGVLMAVVACACVCAWLLHAAPDRGAAARIVPVAWAWGGLALFGAWRVRGGGPAPLGLLLLAGLLTRAPLVGTPWLLSDDAWRYLWEGAVLAEGLNPFAQPPASLPGLDDALQTRVNHPEISSIYPPFALLWFRLAHELGGTAVVAQVLALIADLVALGTLARLTGERGWAGWLYALHPLPALESAGSAHLEAPALALVGLGLVAWKADRRGMTWLGVGGGIGVKLLPVLVLPALVRRLDRRSVAGMLGVLALGLVAAWPVLDAGGGLFTGFDAYARHWSFNGFLWPWLEPVLGDTTRPVLVAGAAAAVGLVAWFRDDPVELFAAGGAAFVLTSPTMHPWYGLWALWPALALGRWWWGAASVGLLTSYGVLLGFDPATGSWSEPAWLWAATWVPVVSVLAAGWIWTRRDASPTTP